MNSAIPIIFTDLLIFMFVPGLYLASKIVKDRPFSSYASSRGGWNFFLRVIYKYSNNRKISVIISVAIVMVMFACLHAYNPIMLIFALFIQGFGSIFEFYGYIKTKNIFVCYLTHLLTDWFVFVIMLLGFA